VKIVQKKKIEVKRAIVHFFTNQHDINAKCDIVNM